MSLSTSAVQTDSSMGPTEGIFPVDPSFVPAKSSPYTDGTSTLSSLDPTSAHEQNAPYSTTWAAGHFTQPTPAIQGYGSLSGYGFQQGYPGTLVGQSILTTSPQQNPNASSGMPYSSGLTAAQGFSGGFVMQASLRVPRPFVPALPLVIETSLHQQNLDSESSRGFASQSEQMLSPSQKTSFPPVGTRNLNAGANPAGFQVAPHSAGEENISSFKGLYGMAKPLDESLIKRASPVVSLSAQMPKTTMQIFQDHLGTYFVGEPGSACRKLTIAEQTRIAAASPKVFLKKVHAFFKDLTSPKPNYRRTMCHSVTWLNESCGWDMQCTFAHNLEELFAYNIHANSKWKSQICRHRTSTDYEHIKCCDFAHDNELMRDLEKIHWSDKSIFVTKRVVILEPVEKSDEKAPASPPKGWKPYKEKR